MTSPVALPEPGAHLLLPVLPLREGCVFPEASFTTKVTRPLVTHALEVASRTGSRVLAVAQLDPEATAPGPKGYYPIGAIAVVSAHRVLTPSEHEVDLDGLERGRVVTFLGSEALVAEVEPLPEGDAGEEWGPAVEALARYLHTHAELRNFLDRQRRSKEPLSWVNLACQHLPITATARQKLLAADARERCLKISRGLDALLRKEHAV